MADLLPFPGSKFMRRESPYGFGIDFQRADDGTTLAVFMLDEYKQGAPGVAHGGAVAAVLDEAMGAACYYAGRAGMTLTMTTNYKAPVPLNVELRLVGRVERVEGKKTFASCELILPDGKIAATATGIFYTNDQITALLSGMARDHQE